MCDEYINNEDILFTSRCSHTFCQDCLKNYFLDKLKEKKIEFFGKPYRFLKNFLIEKETSHKDNVSTKMDNENIIDRSNIIYFEENPFFCPCFQCEDKYNFNDITLLMDINFNNEFNIEKEKILKNLDLIESNNNENNKEIIVKNPFNKKSTFGSSKTSDKKIEESKYIPDFMNYKLFGRKHMFKVDDTNNLCSNTDNESLYNKLYKDKSVFCPNCNMPALIKKPKHKHFQCLNCWKHACKYCNKILTPDHFMINSYENYCRVYFRDRLMQSNEEDRKQMKSMTCLKIVINFFLVIFSLLFTLYGSTSIIISKFSTVFDIQTDENKLNLMMKKLKKFHEDKKILLKGKFYRKKEIFSSLQENYVYYYIKEIFFITLRVIIFLLMISIIWPILLAVPMFISLLL